MILQARALVGEVFKYLLCARNGVRVTDTALIRADMDPDLMKLIS